MEPILSMLTSGMTSPPAGGPITTSMGQMNMGGQPGMMQQQPMGKTFSFKYKLCAIVISVDDRLL